MAKKKASPKKGRRRATKALPEQPLPTSEQLGAATKKVVSAYELASIRIAKIVLEAPVCTAGMTIPHQISAQTDYRIDPEKRVFQAIVRLNGGTDPETNSSGFRYALDMEVSYAPRSAEKAAEVTDEEIRLFCHHNPTFQAWPLARAMLLMVSQQTGFPITLPMFMPQG